MSEEFNKEFMKLSEKDQKSILNLIQLKNMNKQTEYKRRIDKAVEFIKSYKTDYSPYELSDYNVRQILEILKGEDNNE